MAIDNFHKFFLYLSAFIRFNLRSLRPAKLIFKAEQKVSGYQSTNHRWDQSTLGEWHNERFPLRCEDPTYSSCVCDAHRRFLG